MVWYKQDSGLQVFEVECLKRFAEEYGKNLIKIGYNYDSDNRFYASIELKFRIDEKRPFDTWKFIMMYSQDHPSKDADGRFGGSIKIFIRNELKPGFHHVLNDNQYGKYVCQTEESTSDKVNAYYAMKRVMRWLIIYYTWQDTDVDIDM